MKERNWENGLYNYNFIFNNKSFFNISRLSKHVCKIKVITG